MLSFSVRGASVIFAVLLLSAWACILVEGRSDGFLGSCDLTPRYHDYATPPTVMPNGYFGANKTFKFYTYNMNWVDWPVPHAAYTLRSGDGAAASDPTTYVPGVPMDIYLRVADVRKQYIGLLMYATNNTGLLLNGQIGGQPKQTKVEQHIGQWQVRQSDPFELPNTCSPASAPTGSTVTHSDADLKPVRAKFTWTGPAGSGTVRFRVLIKWDGQGRGSFYYPVKELVLKEGKPLPPFDGTQQTVIGQPGANCADTCYLQTPKTPYCNAQALLSIQSASDLDVVLGPGRGLNTPYLAACPYAGAPQIRSDGYAQWRSNDVAATCPQSIQSAPPARMADVCYTNVKKDSQPICVCSKDWRVQTKNPFDATLSNKAAAPVATASRVQRSQAVQQTSAASSKSGSAGFGVVSVLALLGVASAMGPAPSSGRALLLLCVCLCLVALLSPAPVVAHNWINSQKRANVASVNKPCQARIGRQPHVQVIAGQDFEAEWTNGHGDMSGSNPTVFGVVHEANYSQLAAKNIMAIMLDYAALAPADAHFEDDSRYQRHHLHNSKVPSGQAECVGMDSTTNMSVCGDYFGPPINSSDVDFIVRDSGYKATVAKYRETAGYVVTQRKFKPQYIADDVRVSYYSAKYPWLESVSIFPHPFRSPSPFQVGQFTSQSDIARFKIPARNGKGSYILYYAWNSYSDCVDIDVQAGTQAIVNRYGSSDLAAGQRGEIVRMDHCEFRYVQQAQSPCRRMNSSLDASACINACVSKTRCLIQIVKAFNLPSVMSLPVNIPYTVQTATNANCTDAAVFKRVDAGCPVLPKVAGSQMCSAAQIGPLGQDDYVCYEAQVWKDQDTGVEEDWRLAKDPMDPAWYSSCIFAKPAAGFINLPAAPAYTPPPWQIAEQCVNCGFERNLSAITTTFQPNWGKSLDPVCPDCDMRNIQAKVDVSVMVGADASKAGAPWVPRPASSSSSSSSTGRSASSSSTGRSASSSSTGRSASSSSTGRSASSSSTGGAAAGAQVDGGSGAAGAAGGGDNGNVNGGGSGSLSSSSDGGFFSHKLYLILVIVGGAVVLLAGAVGGFALLRRRSAAKAALKRLTDLNSSPNGETQLISNPAANW